jgi:hypothetical protein
MTDAGPAMSDDAIDCLKVSRDTATTVQPGR